MKGGGNTDKNTDTNADTNTDINTDENTNTNAYSLVRLVSPKMEELISRPFLGLSKIRLLSHVRTTS